MNIKDKFYALCELYENTEIEKIYYIKYLFSIFFKINYNYYFKKEDIEQYKTDNEKYELFIKTFFDNIKDDPKALVEIKKFYNKTILLLGGYKKKYKIIK